MIIASDDPVEGRDVEDVGVCRICGHGADVAELHQLGKAVEIESLPSVSAIPGPPEPVCHVSFPIALLTRVFTGCTVRLARGQDPRGTDYGQDLLHQAWRASIFHPSRPQWDMNSLPNFLPCVKSISIFSCGTSGMTLLVDDRTKPLPGPARAKDRSTDRLTSSLVP